MLKLSGLNTFVTKTRKQQQRIKVGAENFVRNKTEAILKDLVLMTPQWSGNTAASWRIELNYLPTVDHVPPEPDWKSVEDVKFKGDTEAWEYAKSVNRRHLEAIVYNSKISIVNNAPYADTLATDPSVKYRLRKGNFIPGDVMAVQTVVAKYNLSATVENLKV